MFGCVAYAKVTGVGVKKLDDRSRAMVYLGVEEGSKAHRLYDPHHGKLYISRDVLFQEDERWQWNKIKIG